MSLKDQILQAEDLKREIVNIPEWGTNIALWSLNVKERAKLMKEITDDKGEINLELAPIKTLMVTMHDPETGERIFSDEDIDNQDTVEIFQTKNAEIVDRLTNISLRLCGLDKRAIKDAEKNF